MFIARDREEAEKQQQQDMGESRDSRPLMGGEYGDCQCDLCCLAEEHVNKT